MALKVKVHRTGAVSSSRVDTAKSTLNNAEDRAGTLSIDFSATGGSTSLDNSQYSSDDHSGWIRYCEDQLHSEGELDNASLHVILYERSVDFSSSNGLDGAGYANWTAGAGPKEDRMGNAVDNRRYTEDGKYAFANVNVTTGNFPYTKQIFKNTVIHELGHCLNAGHGDGNILYDTYDTNYEASPMATWYVEGGCGSHWPDRNITNLCEDESGEGKACHHNDRVSLCTEDWWEDHINSHGGEIKQT